MEIAAPHPLIEVITDLELGTDKNRLVDRHSLLNVFNVLEKLIAELAERTRHPRLAEFADFCVDVLMQLGEPGLMERVPYIESSFDRLLDLLKEMMHDHPEQADRIQKAYAIVGVAYCRIHEFLSDRFEWVWIQQDDIRQKLMQFLGASADFSNNRFRVLTAGDESAANVYTIDLKIDAAEALFAPPVFEDTLRDLVANARKYSSPGTIITIHIEQLAGNGLSLQVSDQGIGIPHPELPLVVNFGYRASNVMEIRTLGGGTGLTKAYLFCKRFGGRFFIGSTLGKGTTVGLTAFPPAG